MVKNYEQVNREERARQSKEESKEKLKKACLLAIIALLIGFIAYISAINAQSTADNNANITNVFEIVVNNTNLAPAVIDHPGTGERVTGATYFANASPIQLLVFAHANTVSGTATVEVNINGTVVANQSGRPLAAAEDTHRSITVIVPKYSSYVVNFSNYHHYEWREYPILSGRNGTLSVNQTFITQGTSFNSTYDAYGSSKVNKSGDNMTGKLYIQQNKSDPDVRGDLFGIQIADNKPGIKLFQNVSDLTNESFLGGWALDSAGHVVKTMSISGMFANNTHGYHVGVIRLLPTYYCALCTNESQTDGGIRIFGNNGVRVFGGASDDLSTAPGQNNFTIVGNLTSNEFNFNDSAFFAVNSTTLGVTAGAFTKIVFDSESYDNLGNHNAATGNFTAPRTGIYDISVSILFNNNAASERKIVSIFKNGVEFLRLADFNSSANNAVTVQSGSFNTKLNVGDNISVYAFNPTGTTIQGSGSHFSIAKIQ